MVTRRDLIKLGALAVTSTGCTQIGCAGGAWLADVGSIITGDQQPAQLKSARAKKDLKNFTAREET
jgi:hypothetical protein